MGIKEIRESTGLSQAKFSDKYGIPLRSLENWESRKRNCPPYLISLLRRVVQEDTREVSCYSAEILRELGYCYNALLHILNKAGNNPYPNAEIFPVKYFVMLLPRAMTIGIPSELNDRIALMMSFLDVNDWESSMNIPVPMEMRMYFFAGMMDYK